MSHFITNPPLVRQLPHEYGFDPRYPWLLLGELRYYSDLLGEVMVVPAGERTDFASVPWAFRRVFPQDGPWTLAAILHDFLCNRRPADISNVMAAKIFREAMAVLEVPKWRREAMYKAVLWFGPKWP